jgi:predicted MPP superfamily phosphohydrolase
MNGQISHHRLSRRTILRNMLYGLFGLFLAPIAGSQQQSRAETGWYETSEYDVEVADLPLELDGLTILHLTDIHQSTVINRDRLMELRAHIDQLQVDAIAVTGDLTYHSTDMSDLQDFFHDLPDRYPVLLVMGNHDYWDGGIPTLQPLLDEGIHLLRNDCFCLERDGARFIIAGLDNVWEEMDDLKGLLRRLPGDGPAMLMVHEPDVADQCAATGRFFLQISGHSHGGQICLPGGFAPVLPWMGQKYYRGYYLVDGMMVYTCRGIGMSKPFIRVNCRPEIVLYHFHPGAKPGFHPVAAGQITT